MCSLINLPHAKLHLRVSFPGNPTCWALCGPSQGGSQTFSRGEYGVGRRCRWQEGPWAPQKTHGPGHTHRGIRMPCMLTAACSQVQLAGVGALLWRDWGTHPPQWLLIHPFTHHTTYHTHDLQLARVQEAPCSLFPECSLISQRGCEPPHFVLPFPHKSGHTRVAQEIPGQLNRIEAESGSMHGQQGACPSGPARHSDCWKGS